MQEHPNGLPHVYIYLDSNGIDSLFAQITERFEIEVVQTRSTRGRAEGGLSLGLGNLLSSLLGIKVGTETKIETIHGHIEEAKTRLTAENKLRQLTEYMVKRKMCFDGLQDAVSAASEPGEVVYLHTIEKFDAPDFYPGRGGVIEINASQSVVFTIEPKHDPSDNYFKRVDSHFIMTAGLRNFTRLHGSMGGTSHEATMFRGFGGRDIPLGVFGYFIRHRTPVYQIKPYAIWLPQVGGPGLMR